jgi:hypothetical protein
VALVIVSEFEESISTFYFDNLNNIVMVGFDCGTRKQMVYSENIVARFKGKEAIEDQMDID